MICSIADHEMFPVKGTFLPVLTGEYLHCTYMCPYELLREAETEICSVNLYVSVLAPACLVL